MIQLELFPELIDEKKELDDIRAEWNRTRKALFMKEAESRKLIQELAHEFQVFKLNICKGKLPV